MHDLSSFPGIKGISLDHHKSHHSCYTSCPHFFGMSTGPGMQAANSKKDPEDHFTCPCGLEKLPWKYGSALHCWEEGRAETQACLNKYAMHSLQNSSGI